jgi:C4-dicarboxylate transporter DctQ subunit
LAKANHIAMGRYLEKFEEGMIASLLAVMTLITFVQVIARYVFNYSFVWALELVSFLFAWLIFIGMSYGVRTGAHIGMDAVVKLLGPRAGRFVTAIATLLCIAYSVIVFIGSWNYVNVIYQIGNYAQDLPIPIWIPRLALPIGFALLTLRFCEVLYRVIMGKETHLTHDEAGAALQSHLKDDQQSGQERP